MIGATIRHLRAFVVPAVAPIETDALPLARRPRRDTDGEISGVPTEPEEPGAST